jgi:EpsI family protein
VKSRRNMMLGAACLMSAGAAQIVKPRRKQTLLAPGKKLTEILPRRFNDWTSRDVSDLYAPQTPDSLTARLYGDTVGRIYFQEETGSQIMMLIAHGDSQSNELQLHRPEVCYPAFGFTLVESQPVELTIGKAATLPGRRLIAQSSQQKQAVIYWTRLGEYFPITVTEQRLERLNTAMHRYIPDGVLARFSVPGPDSEIAFKTMREFITQLIAGIDGGDRAVLIGTARAVALAATSHAR